MIVDFNKYYRKFSFMYAGMILCFITFQLLLFFIFGYTVILNIGINVVALIVALVIIFKFSKEYISDIEYMFITANNEKEAQYEKTIKNIYDEHIFAITHELRSPLSVISGCSINEMSNLKTLYSILEKNNILTDSKDLIVQHKRMIESVQNQVDQIENFIYNITEHGSYICNKEDSQRILILYPYLINIIINSHSFSRSMKMFNDRVAFSGDGGVDFDGVTLIVNPHDLSHIIMNIMNNAADAVEESYNLKRKNDETYTPHLNIKCIKSGNDSIRLKLNSSFIPMGMYARGCPMYILFEDNGPGIGNQTLEKILDVSKNYTTKNDKSHYGFGLNLSFKLAEKNDIQIYINTSNSGTIFALGFNKCLFSDKHLAYHMTTDCMKNIEQYTTHTHRYEK